MGDKSLFLARGKALLLSQKQERKGAWERKPPLVTNAG